MAPNDREDRRRQRARGAGTRQLPASTFSFGLPQSSQPLIPRASSRRTPQPRPPSARKKTPNGSAKSSAKSGALKPIKTPRANATPSKFITPTVTGKRKRGGQDDRNAPDELEQNDEDHMASSTRRNSGARPAQAGAATISPRERMDTVPDELEANDENHMVSSGQKRRRTESKSAEATPVTSKSNENTSISRKRKRTPLAAIEESITSMQRSGSVSRSIVSARRQADVHTPKNGPVTPKEQHKSTKTTKPRPTRTAPEVDEEVDDLSPDKGAKFPKPKQTATEELADEEVDDLSPDKSERPRIPKRLKSKAKPVTQRQPMQREVVEVNDSQPELEEEAADELSPEVDRTRQKRKTGAVSQRAVEAETLAEEHREPEDELSTPAPIQKPRGSNQAQRVVAARAPTRASTAHTDAQGVNKSKAVRAKSASSQPRIKRARVPVTVYRLFYPKKKSSDEASDEDVSKPGTRVVGISGVDVIAEYFNQLLDREVKEYYKRTERSKNRDQRRQNRQRMILIQDFKHAMEDQLLDLSEAVDAGTGWKRNLQIKTKEKLTLREELLELRQQREEILLKKDELREEQEERKATRERNEFLSETFFDIEATISAGRSKAKKERREDEGPEIPLEMLLGDIANDVGSEGGGLLSNVRAFNGVLERAAGVLEGRF